MIPVLQGTCLSLIWVTFQCGLLMMATLPDPKSGTAFLYLVVLANIVLMVSPPVIVGLAFLRCLPRPWRLRISVFLGIEPPAEDAAGNDHARNRSSSDFASDEMHATKSLDDVGADGVPVHDLSNRALASSGGGLAIEMSEFGATPLPDVVVASMDASPDVDATEHAHRQQGLLALPEMNGWNFNPMLAPSVLRTQTRTSVVAASERTGVDPDAAARIQALEHALALAKLNQSAVDALSASSTQ